MTKKSTLRRPATLLGLTAMFSTMTALAALDVVGPPPADDVSALTPLLIGNEINGVALEDMIPPMEGALEIQNHAHADPGLDNSLLNGLQADDGGGECECRHPGSHCKENADCAGDRPSGLSPQQARTHVQADIQTVS